MKRVDSCLLLIPLALAVACAGDDAASGSNSNSNSGSATESNGTDSAGTDSQGTLDGDTSAGDASQSGTSNSDTGTNSQGDASQSGTDSQGTDSQGTDSQGTDSQGTDSQGTDSQGTDSQGTDSQGTDSQGTDSAGDSTGTTGGGVVLPPVPEDPPGVEEGFCNPPGMVRWCWTGAPGNYQVGLCEPGIQQCEPIDLDVGQWGPCEEETLPELEVCDSFDNDCDAQTDEDLGVTNCGLGLCNHDEPNCIDGLVNECDPDLGAQFEVCDSTDNDCDGDIDEGLGTDSETCGLGVCNHTVTACEGLPLNCDPLEGSTNETCDGLDNDCDGEEDEGLGTTTCGLGICEHTIDNCIGGVPQMCDPFEGQEVETCDGLDNDCDGLTDEDQGFWTCGNAECEVSIPKCVNGVPVPEADCNPDPGNEEICGDGEDQDCDGVDPPCAETFLVGTDTTARPIDVIWGVDGSGSMAAEMAVVESEINDFADALNTAAGNGSQNTLHLLADADDTADDGDTEICVSPPLGAANCGDHNAPRFYHWDNDTGGDFIHSSNALARFMQQSEHTDGWGFRRQPGSYIAYIVTTDDDGDDVEWVAPNDPETEDDCQNGSGFVSQGTENNVCRWNAPGAGLNYTSLADDLDFDGGGVDFLGFKSFMANFYPAEVPSDDWAFYSIIGATGDIAAPNDVYEFTCPFQPGGPTVEGGEEYVKLSLFTGVQDQMIGICQADWDLTGLANSIGSSVPNDTYVLTGSPPAFNCLAIDQTSITVIVNGIPMNPADWSYDALNCTVTINNNVPVVGDNVVIIYNN